MKNSAKSKPEKTKRPKKLLDQQTTAEGAIAYGGLIEEYHDPRIARLAIQVGAFALVGFLGWATIAPVHELTIGQGSILPTGFVQRLQHLEGGNVTSIFVREGQNVLAGQPLVELSDVAMRAELTKAQSRLEFLNLAIQRQTQISSGDMQTLLSGDNERFSQLLNSQQTASSADEVFRQAQLDVISAEVQMKSAELNSLETRVEKINEEFALVEQQLADYENAFLSGAISRRERDAILRDKLNLESERAALQGQMLSARASVAEGEARAAELAARFTQQAVIQIADLEIEKAETLELVAQLEDRLDRTILRAPVDGTVNNLSVRNPGQVVSPGETVAEIVPQSGSIFAEVDIAPDQIGYVHAGMEANVKVLTFDFARFGAIEGVVVDVSPTSIANDRGEYFYRVRLELDDIFVGDASEGRQVTPGMAVTADIKLGDKSVLSYLLKPLRAISDRAFSER